MQITLIGYQGIHDVILESNDEKVVVSDAVDLTTCLIKNNNLNKTAISPGFILERIWKMPYSVAWEAVWWYQTEILTLKFEPEIHKETSREI